MKKSIKLFSFGLAMAMLLSLFAACADTTMNEVSSAQPQSQAQENEMAQEQENGFPVTITDHLDREITIEQKPEKLVSGYYVSTSMLIALGLKDSVVGIEAKADTRPIYKLSAPEFLELPNVGTAKEFNLEGCIELAPDLVILPVSLKEQTQGLIEVGLNVIYVNPENTALLEEAFLAIGSATGTKERAEEIIAYSQTALSELSDKIGAQEQKTLYLAGNSDFLSTAGEKMYQNTMIENAHGINVAAEIEDTYWATVSYEQILAYKPEYIILAAAADYTEQDVLSDANIQSTTAVQNGNVFAMPSDIEAWDSPVPSAFLGSLWLASKLYPDSYSEEEYNEKVSEFYMTYYGFEAP